MAVLKSEESDCPSHLELKKGKLVNLTGDQSWVQVTVDLVSGDLRLTTPSDADYLLFRQPRDETRSLVELLEALIGKRTELVLFEPSEPSFELKFERASRGGIKVEVWLDAGNASTGFYTWDAAGIRFYTTDEHVVSFIRELKLEFLNDPAERRA